MLSSWSLKRRLLATSLLVLGAFLLLAGFALEQGFRSNAEQARTDRLQANVYMLMGMAEVGPDASLDVAEMLPEPTLAVPDSGIYGSISDAQGNVLWQSQSSLTDTPEYPQTPAPGKSILQTVTTTAGREIVTLSFPVIWERGEQQELNLIFRSGESSDRVKAEVQAFRGSLQKWLGGGALVLLALQFVMLLWVTRPLNRVTDELRAVEAGQREALSDDYPSELSQLTRHLNSLIESNQTRLRRYRNSLSDLAHSLKTPLALARKHIETNPADDNLANYNEVLEQLDSIDATIEYQLHRASASGRSPLAAPIEVAPAVERIVNSLRKVYQDKGLTIEIDIEPGTRFRGDSGDLIEIIGNLADNACKWAKSSICIRALNVQSPDTSKSMRLTVSDDGPGIPPALRQDVLQRGVRADTRRPGQGIGLASVHELVVEIYGGRIEIGEADLGGATVLIEV